MVPQGPPELKKKAKCPNAFTLFPEATEGWYNHTTEEKSEHVLRRYGMIEILRKRRSIRRYQAKAIDSQALEVMKEALLRSPSSRGINPWVFIFVDQKELLLQLSRAKEQGAQFIKDAALAVVVCADETKSDVWVEDCSIAAIVAQLAAESLGLGSCWSQIRERAHSKEKSAEKYIQELLHLPGNLRVLSIIAIGIPAESKAPIAKEQLDYTKIQYNRY
jgi:nitroreductase